MVITKIKDDIENLRCGHDDQNQRMIKMRSKTFIMIEIDNDIENLGCGRNDQNQIMIKKTCDVVAMTEIEGLKKTYMIKQT